MARFRIALLVAIGSGGAIALLAACNAVLGLGDYSEVACTDDCDAGIDAPDVDANPDAPPIPDAAPDAAIDVEAGSYNSHYAWPSWPMPNPRNDAGYPNAASYDGGGDAGVVFDLVTALQWENRASGPSTANNILDAQTYCARLPAINGKSWRLPTRIELVTLIDYSRASSPMIDPVFGSTSGIFWTSSPVAPPSTKNWTIDFTSGAVSSHTDGAFVRCVAGGVVR